MSAKFRNARAAIASEAAGWVIQIDDGVLALDVRKELLAWLRSSPQHIDEFLMATAAWQELDGLDIERQLDVDKLIAQAKQNVVVLEAGQDTGTSSHGEKAEVTAQWNWPKWAAAAAFFIVIGTGLAMRMQGPQPEFMTDLGQQLSFTLADGSVVQLNTQSALNTRFTEKQREITLLRGEAMFDVAKDPSRPFRVHSGSVVVEAIGTRFNVYQREDSVRVSVEEGTVSVGMRDARTTPGLQAVRLNAVEEIQLATLVLKAGEEAQAGNDGGLVRIEKPDFEKSTAWRERRLVFRSDSLETVAAEFNRYNRQIIDIQIPAQLSREITGTFDADDPEAFVAFLKKDASLDVIHQKDRIVVRPLRTAAR